MFSSFRSVLYALSFLRGHRTDRITIVSSDLTSEGHNLLLVLWNFYAKKLQSRHDFSKTLECKLSPWLVRPVLTHYVLLRRWRKDHNLSGTNLNFFFELAVYPYCTSFLCRLTEDQKGSIETETCENLMNRLPSGLGQRVKRHYEVYLNFGVR